MKKQRYRIVITTYSSGIKEYKPEKRKGLWWKGIHRDGTLSEFKTSGERCRLRDDALLIIDRNVETSTTIKVDFEYINKLIS